MAVRPTTKMVTLLGVPSAAALVGCGAETNAVCGPGDPCPTGFTGCSGGCYRDHDPIGCRDAVGDELRTGPACPATEDIDCNPGRAEICGERIDQSCLAGADGGCVCTDDVGVGTSRDGGMGRRAGVQTCTETGWGECSSRVAPEPENCGSSGMGDGVDDDRDGEVDDVTCGPRPDGMGAEGVCVDDAGDPFYCSSNGTCTP